MQIMSPEEKAALERKREELYKAKIDVTDRIRKAASLGDLSENAEYHFAKEENRNIDRELAELEAKLRNVQVVSTDNVPEDMVYLGHTVRLQDMDDDSEQLVRLVGEAQPPSADSDVLPVSVSSPMGEALMKARVGDTVKVKAPRGTMEFKILEIVGVTSKETDSRADEISSKVEYFRASPRLIDPYQEPLPGPKEKGVYGWYFREIPVPAADMPAEPIVKEGWTLLYVGIAPEDAESNQGMGERLILHLKRTVAVSTLRRSLRGCLKKSEEDLTTWLKQNARIAWQADERPWEVELAILKHYGGKLPLNIEHNREQNRFAGKLTKLRAAVT